MQNVGSKIDQKLLFPFYLRTVCNGLKMVFVESLTSSICNLQVADNKVLTDSILRWPIKFVTGKLVIPKMRLGGN
jgi:hypothetical protein